MAAIGTPPKANAPKATVGERETSSGEPLDLYNGSQQESQIGDMLKDHGVSTPKNAKPDGPQTRQDEDEEQYHTPDGDMDPDFEPEEQDEDEDLEGYEDEDEYEDDEEEEEDDLEEDDEEEVDEEDDKDEVIARLRRQLDEKYASGQQTEAQEQGDKTPASEQLKLTLDNELVEDALADPVKMVELLQNVFEQGREAVLRNIPNLVASTVQRQSVVQTAVQDFYVKNPKLKENMNYVGFITNQVQDEHPDWTVEQILNEAAVRSYKGLGIKVKAKAREQKRQENVKSGKGPKKEKPAFATKPRGSGRRGVTKDVRSSMQKQIDDLI